MKNLIVGENRKKLDYVCLHKYLSPKTKRYFPIKITLCFGEGAFC